jgi:cytochrome c oxidase subunit I
MAGVYYWLPKWVGRMYDMNLGKWHFWLSAIFFNVLFFPQHFLGLAGMPRRIPDYAVQFADWNMVSSIGGFAFGLSQLLFPYLIWKCVRSGRPDEGMARRARPRMGAALAGAVSLLDDSAHGGDDRPRRGALSDSA